MSKNVTIIKSDYEMLKGQAEAWEAIFNCIEGLDSNCFRPKTGKTGIELAVAFIEEQYAKAQLLDSLYSNQEED